MNTFEEINQQLDEDDSEIPMPIPRKAIKEPTTRYDYCEIIAKEINRPTIYIMSRLKGQPINWILDLISEMKHIRDKTQRVKFIYWYMRESNLCTLKSSR